MEEAWNINMAKYFKPSLFNVLEKSMMEWFKKYALGFMCVGHTICCGLMSIFWIAKIVEGKDLPQHLGQKEYNELGKR